MNIGQRIRDLRKANSLTLVELASKIHISQPYLSQIERGDKQAPIETILKICDVIKIELPDFFSSNKQVPPNLHQWLITGKQLTSEQRQVILNTIDKLRDKK